MLSGKIAFQSRTLEIVALFEHLNKMRGRSSSKTSKHTGLPKAYRLNFQILATVSTSWMEKTKPFFVHKCDNFDSMRFATSMGVCKLGADCRAIATKLKTLSTSSCVWPTCRWWQDATPHRPACAMLARNFAPCWFLTSFTVLSLCNHSLISWHLRNNESIQEVNMFAFDSWLIWVQGSPKGRACCVPLF